MNFDFNETPFSDSRVITHEQADMAKIKLACVDIFLENAPKKKSEIDNILELCEQGGIYKMQFVSLHFQGIGFVPSSDRQQYTLHWTSSRNTNTVLYV